MSEYSIYLLSDEENALMATPRLSWVVALDLDGKVIGYVSLDITQRYRCDVCVGRCGIGGYLWTHPDHRHQGILATLFEVGRAELNVDKLYHSGGQSLEAGIIYWKYGLTAAPSAEPMTNEPAADIEGYMDEVRAKLQEILDA
jgi:GNAT superfamily N-acetyltransferase